MQQIVETRANVFDAVVFQAIQKHMGHTDAANLINLKTIRSNLIRLLIWAENYIGCDQVESEDLGELSRQTRWLYANFDWASRYIHSRQTRRIPFTYHKKKCVSIESEPLSSIACNTLRPSNWFL